MCIYFVLMSSNATAQYISLKYSTLTFKSSRVHIFRIVLPDYIPYQPHVAYQASFLNIFTAHLWLSRSFTIYMLTLCHASGLNVVFLIINTRRVFFRILCVGFNSYLFTFGQTQNKG